MFRLIIQKMIPFCMNCVSRILLVGIFLLLFFVLFLAIHEMWGELSVGRYSSVVAAHGQEFKAVIDAYEQAIYSGSRYLPPETEIEAIFEYSDTCAIVYVKTFRKSSGPFYDYFELQKKGNLWVVKGDYGAVEGMEHPTCSNTSTR